MRSLILFGAVALTVIPPVAAFGAPPRGAAHGAPVFVRPTIPERSDRAERGAFEVPFEVAPTSKLPSQTIWRGWALRPTLLWNPSLCLASLAPWAGQGVQPMSNDQFPGIAIGSLAGDPSRSIFARSPSDIAAITQSSNAGVNTGSLGAFSFQFSPRPTLCGQPTFGAF